jgi:hypothetical protein
MVGAGAGEGDGLGAGDGVGAGEGEEVGLGAAPPVALGVELPPPPPQAVRDRASVAILSERDNGDIGHFLANGLAGNIGQDAPKWGPGSRHGQYPPFRAR